MQYSLLPILCYFTEVSPLCLYEQQVVLDIGCGTGEATTTLLDRLPQVEQSFAVDKSSEFIEYATETNNDSQILYRHMDAEDEWSKDWSNKFTLVRKTCSKM